MHVYSGAETQEGRHGRPRIGPAEGGGGENGGRAGGHAVRAGGGGTPSAGRTAESDRAPTKKNVGDVYCRVVTCGGDEASCGGVQVDSE